MSYTTNIFIVVLLLISVANNFWMYHNYHNYHNYDSRISNNIMSKNVKYKNFIIFYKPNKLYDPDNKISLHVNKLAKNNQTIILSKSNGLMDFNKIDFGKINSMEPLK